jgi:2-polyprenyl-6-methoxyphenol hydroxylase-like FAD-dependent oxidoreductase
MQPDATVAIIGAGPVGLFLGCRLATLGVSVLLVEQRVERFSHSRSIGIHPPALEVLARIGLDGPLLARGMRIGRARGFAEGRLLGVLDLGCCPAPYPFVLTLPQPVTEGLLAARLEQLAPDALQRGGMLAGLSQDHEGVTLELTDGTQLRADLAIGCDGRNSAARRLTGIPVTARQHSDHYVMADLADTSDLGSDAAIYLTRAGVVESFPLPGGQRRWVARTDGEAPAGTREALQLLTRLVRERAGFELPVSAAMVSAFGTETQLARSLVQGRVVLAGDAAHVISPIGGQGLNLGWLGAERLARAIALAQGSPQSTMLLASLMDYSRVQLQAAGRAARRAQLNMWLGRGWQRPWLRDRLLRLALGPPLVQSTAGFFTMRKLGREP